MAKTAAQFMQELEALRHRILGLEAAATPAFPETLQTAIEELHIAEQELLAQNEALLTAHQVVEQERQRYAALFELVPDGYLVTDAAGLLLEANHAATVLLATSHAELLGKPLVLFVARADRKAFHTRLSRLTAPGRIQDWELQIQPHRGEPFPACITLTASHSLPGQELTLHWLLRDLTAQKQLEAQRRRTEHLAFLGKLAAGLSHELRNPLGAVFLHVDLLEEELRQPAVDSPEQVTESFREIKTQLARLDDLVQNYLSLVRVSTIQRELTDISTMLTTVPQELTDRLTAHGITLRYDGVDRLGLVPLHSNTFRRAVLNLLQNAMEAMPQGGAITLRGQRRDSQVLLEVQDTGDGIPAEHIPRLFEPLYTTKPGGTGLGLYIVQEIVAAHGGQVAVHSTRGRGTTFTITLPITTPEHVRASAASVSPPGSAGG
jgi:PAS domain S-box-containing protein